MLWLPGSCLVQSQGGRGHSMWLIVNLMHFRTFSTAADILINSVSWDERRLQLPELMMKGTDRYKIQWNLTGFSCSPKCQT